MSPAVSSYGRVEPNLRHGWTGVTHSASPKALVNTAATYASDLEAPV